MAININQSRDRVEIPTVVLRGRETSEDGSRGGLINHTITNDITEDTTGAGPWRNQDTMIFSGNVRATITPDPKFSVASYSNRSSLDVENRSIFVGETQISDRNLGLFSETYYTLNGKNPKRTKSNLYIGAFIVRRNESGSDNVILKVRTYYQGNWSKVFRTEFRVGRDNTRLV